MKIFTVLMIPWLLFAAAPSQAQETLCITDVTLIDASHPEPRPGMTVIVRDGLIADVAPAGRLTVPEGATVVDGTGRYLIPGLWDAHVHLSWAGAGALEGFIRHGVTSVRDMGSDLSDVRYWRAAVREGKIQGPRILTAGPAIESAGFMEMIGQVDIALDIPLGPALLPTRVGVSDEDGALSTVRALHEKGVDFVKVRSVPSGPVYRAILEAARDAGLMVVGHEPLVVPLAEASELGQRSIEHLPFLSMEDTEEARRRALFEGFAHNDTWVVPTLVAWQTYRLVPDSISLRAIEQLRRAPGRRRQFISDGLLDFWEMQLAIKALESPMDWQGLMDRGLADLHLMRESGVRFMAGSDFSLPLLEPGRSLHRELVLMVEEGGLSPYEAIECATLNPAVFFGISDSLGTIETGRIADLVLLDADPLADIANIRAVSTVIAGGRVVR